MCSKGCIIGFILLLVVLNKSLEEFDSILIGEESEKVFEKSLTLINNDL